jgi:hypothetical protein
VRCRGERPWFFTNDNVRLSLLHDPRDLAERLAVAPQRLRRWRGLHLGALGTGTPLGARLVQTDALFIR